MEQSDADRAAVAREVLTELEQHFRDDPLQGLGATAATVVKWFRDEHYPAPPAPETVTVTFRDGSTETLSLRDGKWQSGTGLLYDELIERACLDRIASDARVIQERDARIAELETQLQRALDGAVFHEKRAHHAEQERDAALRALEDWKQAALTLGESLTPNGPDGYYAMTPAEWLKWAKAATSQGEGLAEKGTVNSEDAKAQVVREPTRPASPAPIPLGAVVEVEGEGGVESWVWDGKLWTSGGGVMPFEAVRWRALMLTALYRARHPVATRETVERVRKALLQAFRATRVGEDFTENCTRAALTAAGFTLEEGA